MLSNASRVGLRRASGSLKALRSTAAAVASEAPTASEAEVRPFEDIPMIPGVRIPMLGNMLQMGLKARQMDKQTGEGDRDRRVGIHTYFK